MTTETPLCLAKTPSGVVGLDEITGGGLPAGRPTLLCGGAGAGKTLFALTFLVEGAMKLNEPGVFMCFEENEEELARNVASLGYDLPALVASGRLVVDHVHVERSEIEETGEYDLDGLFVRLGHAIKSVGAKRVALDTLEVLFASFSDAAVLRAELRRMFRWLKDQGVTAVITAERGEAGLTRHGLEEYVSDCVILLDHRVVRQVATRSLRVVKYRGSSHGTNEYPFLIDVDGLTVLPVTSLGLAHEVSFEWVSTGIRSLDEMLEGRGYYRGSSVLVSGEAGTGKSTVAAHFAEAASKRGEKALYFAFEESPLQIMRNMKSVGIDLAPWVEAGQMRFLATRPTVWGLEMHLAHMQKAVMDFAPDVVVLDPIGNLSVVGAQNEVRSMLTRLVDYLKRQNITALFTMLHGSAGDDDRIGVSSIMDVWLDVQTLVSDGERNRGLYVLKARGVAHSNQIREFVLTKKGVQLRDVYLGVGGVLTGSARIAQDLVAAEQEIERRQLAEVKMRESQRRKRHIEAQIAALQAELEEQAAEAELFLARQRSAADRSIKGQQRLATSRGVDG